MVKLTYFLLRPRRSARPSWWIWCITFCQGVHRCHFKWVAACCRIEFGNKRDRCTATSLLLLWYLGIFRVRVSFLLSHSPRHERQPFASASAQEYGSQDIHLGYPMVLYFFARRLLGRRIFVFAVRFLMVSKTTLLMFFCRPRSMKVQNSFRTGCLSLHLIQGGDLHWIFEPYGLYQEVR